MFTGIFDHMGIENACGEAWLFAASIDGVMMYYILDEQDCPLEDVRRAVLERYRLLIKKSNKGGSR
jgi:hypothetical protein